MISFNLSFGVLAHQWRTFSTSSELPDKKLCVTLDLVSCSLQVSTGWWSQWRPVLLSPLTPTLTATTHSVVLTESRKGLGLDQRRGWTKGTHYN